MDDWWFHVWMIGDPMYRLLICCDFIYTVGHCMNPNLLDHRE